jgi:short-subunit dehydrogenase
MNQKALLIGNSDGIGLATTNELLKRGWMIHGISRSESPIMNPCYEHWIGEVQRTDFSKKLSEMLKKSGSIDLCIYFAGIGELLDFSNMENEIKIFEVNLIGLVKTVCRVIPMMVSEGKGHFMGISSVADQLLSPEAPSYHASKAGFSNYLEGLALALKPKSVHVTNIRFGFVDTKMAKGAKKPLMMEVEQAVQHLLRCIEKKPLRYTAPRTIIPLVKFRDWMLRSKMIAL